MGEKIIASFKGNITDLDMKANVLINFVSPEYEEVYENKIGIVEKTPLLSKEIAKELSLNPDKRSVITAGSGLNTDYIIHMIKRTISPMINNKSMGFYICETTILDALYETLKLKDIEVVGIPLIFGFENQDIISLATVNACRRFFEEYPDSTIKLILIADNRVIIDNNSVDIDVAAQTAEISSDILRKLKLNINQDKVGLNLLKELENIKFLEFGSEKLENTVNGDIYALKNNSFLTSQEIDILLFGDEEDIEGDNNEEPDLEKTISDINLLLNNLTHMVGGELEVSNIKIILEILGILLVESKDNYGLTINVSKSGKININIKLE